MAGNIFGKSLTICSFGESHGIALGVVVDGLPGGLDVRPEELQAALDRRKPGQAGTTTRQEGDKAEILSGVFAGKTLGTPICVIVRNENQRSADYDSLKNSFRVGHADRTTLEKYGVRDHRGGGRSSGRETLARVIGGYFASLVLPDLKFSIDILQLGELANIAFPLAPESVDYLKRLQSAGESVGGRVQIRVQGVPRSLGEPVFDKLKADLAKALLSIGGITSFSYGIGEEFAIRSGSECAQHVEYFGGMEGGISNGEELVITFTVKPTSTVGEQAKQGRHDPSIVPRVIPVVEAMIKLVLADHLLRNKIYEK